MRRTLARTLTPLLAAVLSAVSYSLGETTDAPQPPRAATAKVTYLTSVTVYVDAGRDDGLREGDTVEIVREEQVIASLKVTYLSSHLAACTVTQSSAAPAVGDVARFQPAVSPPPAPTPASAGSAAAGAAAGSALKSEAAPQKKTKDWARAVGIRGRVGVRYLWVEDKSAGGNRFSQPALDLRLDGNRVGGSPFDFAVDVRSRRTSQTFADGTSRSDGENRVYRAAAAYGPKGSGLKVTLGRQYSPSLATISIFDGLAMDFHGARVSAGGMTGTQPDPASFGHSSEIQEHGLYVQFHNLPQEKKLWSFTSGAIGSYDQGEVNREFLYLQGQYVGTRVTGYLAQEIDYNRGWKSDLGESTISPTSTFGSLNVRATDHLDLYGGYDNRRNVRLWRDRITPETEFDDSYRQGTWVGAMTRFASRYGVGIDLRSSGGGSAGSADSCGLRFQADRITKWNLGFHLRSTQYTGDFVEGWLQSLGVGMTPTQRLHFELSGGVREEAHPQYPALDGRLTWFSLDLDYALGRHWYLLVSGESDTGDLASTNQTYLSVTYRF